MNPPAWWRAAAAAAIFSAAVVFLTVELAANWNEFDSAIRELDAVGVGGAFVAGGAAMVVIALGWHQILTATVQRAPREVIAWYFAGEIGKYLPGGIWPVVGRAELATRSQVARSTSYGTVLVSLAALYVVGAWTVLIVSLGFTTVAVGPLVTVGTVGLALFGSLVFVPAAQRRLSGLVRRVSGRTFGDLRVSSSAMARAVLLYAAAWLLIGSSTWAVAEAIDPSVSWNGIVAAAIVSWVAGFLAVPVPGGVGVREATFVLAVPDLASGDALAVATVARVLFVLVDGIGALAAARAIGRSN